MADFYTPLDEAKKEVRLICLEPSDDWDCPISCEISNHCLDSAPPYQALSYVWGDPHDLAPIIVNGCVMTATTNLIAFLRELRPRTYKKLRRKTLPDAQSPILGALWVDSICIDQSNVAERSQQVVLMEQIYSQAEMTLAWLGEAKEASSLAMTFLHVLGNVLATIPENSGLSLQWRDLPQLCFAEDERHEQFSTVWLSIQRLLDRDYWSRAWTFQEMVIPTSVRLMCGSATCELSRIVLASIWLWNSSSSDCPSGIDQGVWMHITETRPYLQQPMNIGRAHFQYRGRPGNNFDHDCTAWPQPQYDWDLLLQLRGKQATFAHDAIYAFLAVTGLPIKPDYTLPLSQLYFDVAKLGVQCKRLEVVLCCAAKLEGHHTSVHLQSWVSEWLPTKQGCAGAFIERFLHIYHANSRVSASMPPKVADNGNLILTGKIYDSICHTGPVSKPFGVSEQVLDILHQYQPGERYVTGITTLQAVLRTIMCDHDGRGHRLQLPAGRNHDVFMRIIILALAGDLQSTSSYPRGTVPKSRSLLGMPVGEEEFAATYARDVLDEDGCETTGNSFKEVLAPYINDLVQRDGEEDKVGQHLSALVEKTRLLLTKQGYLGMAPSAVQEGDCVVLSPCSRVPLVLRKQGPFCHNIGPCFMLGLMDGEGLGGESVCQTFTIV